MQKLFSIALLALTFAFFSTTDALALSLSEAKDQGLVGEQSDGYLGVVSANTEAQALVDDINSKRKAKYEKIAQENGQSLDLVEKMAAAKVMDRLKAGHYYKDGESWQQK